MAASANHVAEVKSPMWNGETSSSGTLRRSAYNRGNITCESCSPATMNSVGASPNFQSKARLSANEAPQANVRMGSSPPAATIPVPTKIRTYAINGGPRPRDAVWQLMHFEYLGQNVAPAHAYGCTKMSLRNLSGKTSRSNIPSQARLKITVLS